MDYYRCANECFGYCSGTPEWNIDPRELDEGYIMGGHCKLDPNTCGKYQTFGESITRQVKEVKARMEPSGD